MIDLEVRKWYQMEERTMHSRQTIEYIDQNPDCVVDDPQDSRFCNCEDCLNAREWIKAHQDLWQIYQTFGKYKALRAL